MRFRTIAYVDGFNLYFGLKSKGWRRYYWLDVDQLVRRLLRSDHDLLCVKYFTSHITDNPEKQKRQITYLEALSTLPGFHIFYGKYIDNEYLCPHCNCASRYTQEKMTDVNIATELLRDAFQDQFDTAYLISADSDLSAPLRTVHELFPQKHLVVGFPPARCSKELQSLATYSFHISRKALRRSLFPLEVCKSDGVILKCPESWRPSAEPCEASGERIRFAR